MCMGKPGQQSRLGPPYPLGALTAQSHETQKIPCCEIYLLWPLFPFLSNGAEREDFISE